MEVQARKINGHCGGVVTEVARASGDEIDASDIAALFDRTPVAAGSGTARV